MAKAAKVKKAEVVSNKDRVVRAPNVKLPPGVSMKPLSAGVRPAGFLIVPTEEHPNATTFVGILRAMGEKASARRDMKPSVWGTFEAIADQPDSHVYDRETGETHPVTKGMLVGVSKKGALHGMNEEKIGYLFAIEWTGRKIDLGKAGFNDMWEVLAETSEEPYVTEV